MYSTQLATNIFYSILFFAGSLQAQHPGYFGAGSNNNVTITASGFVSDSIWISNPVPANTMNGSGLDAAYMEASRFLSQATIGYDEEEVDSVLSKGIDGWIDSQFSMPIDYFSLRMQTMRQVIADSCMNVCGNSFEICNPPRTPGDDFSMLWWDGLTKSKDLLRNRIAFALSEIFVISRNGRLGSDGDALTSYYDVLYKNSFGNYRDLLYDVTLNASMAEYLTHINNPKTDADNFIFPDENYAREILQLFTVGLWELNANGSLKLDGNQQAIPTYSNYEIGEFAKIFTGLSYGGIWQPSPHPSCDDAQISFGMHESCADMTVPMAMYEEHHETGVKNLLNGFVVPAGLTGLEDIDTTMAHLMDHSNIGPFVSYRLIQRLVKSNPTPAYVERVSSTFTDNGSGIKGDMKAVIKAILLDPEARNCSFQNFAKNSKLKEPVMKRGQFVRMMELERETGDFHFWDDDTHWKESTSQTILNATSVFNFFTPEDKPRGPIQDAGLVAPEFKILDEVTLPGYANKIYEITTGVNRIFRHTLQDNGSANNRWCSGEYTYWYQDQFYEYGKDPEYFINWLDKNFTAGSMSDRTRQLLRDAADEILTPSFNSTLEKDRIDLLTYLLMLSPDFNITK